MSLKQKNDEAMARARENDRKLRNRRESYLHDKDVSRVEHDRRVEDERHRLNQVRQQ